MTTTPRFTSADLDGFPDDGKRYEIIDGELNVSEQPHLYHQFVCSYLLVKLEQWPAQSGKGRAVAAPGLIFAEDDDVAPDRSFSARTSTTRFGRDDIDGIRHSDDATSAGLCVSCCGSVSRYSR